MIGVGELGQGAKGSTRAARGADFVWAVSAVALTLLESICRLGARALATMQAGLTAAQWLLFAVSAVCLCYVEGYRALQRRFVPHLVERAASLGFERRGRPLLLLFAPLYAASLLGAGRRSALRAYASVALIAAAVLIVRALPQPFRGIVDGAVALALSWGLAALVFEIGCQRRATGSRRGSKLAHRRGTAAHLRAARVIGPRSRRKLARP